MSTDRKPYTWNRLLRQRFLVYATLTAAALAVIIAGCSNGSTTTTTASGMASASVMLSDPATCQAPNGPFSHVYVTVTDVKASVNATAGDSDPSFVDLTPGLAAQPKQIDLLGLPDTGCFLATLGATTQLQPGNYQQIRLILADNGTTVTNNACSGSANCVVLSAGGVHPLLLSSESKTGIKITSGQIGNGGFNIAAGQTKDLDIDFNTCVSIVQEGNGQYRLKPVLHAGEVTTTATSINGTVVDAATGNAINGSVLVALEQKDANGVDRVFMNTLAVTGGRFVFCPLPAGTYDVVIVAESSSGVVYAPVVITGVSPGSTLSVVQLHAQPALAAGPATLSGQVTTQTAAPAAGTSADVQVSALAQASSSLTVTIPLLPNTSQSGATLSVASASGNACPTNTDCANFSMLLPALAPYVGTFSASGTTLTQSSLAASYAVDGMAFVPTSGGTLDCTPSEVKSGSVLPVAGATASAGVLAFTSCTAGF